MNDAPDLVLVTELTSIMDRFDSDDTYGWDGADLLDWLLAMPPHIRAALAKKLLEDA
jgi:hypothetical protein